VGTAFIEAQPTVEHCGQLERDDARYRIVGWILCGHTESLPEGCDITVTRNGRPASLCS
jgi:hypothetical protein